MKAPKEVKHLIRMQDPFIINMYIEADDDGRTLVVSFNTDEGSYDSVRIEDTAEDFTRELLRKKRAS